MIVIKTNLKKIPDKCSNCKYHRDYYDRSCYCRIEDKPVDYNYEVSGYMQPDWCPLQEVEDIVDKDRPHYREDDFDWL